MLLEFDRQLIIASPTDAECARLADRHYSRRTHGSPQFMPNGKKLILRDASGLVVFGWLWCPPQLRADSEYGYNLTIFRNESDRRASELILEAERHICERWGPRRLFTYVDPRKVQPTIVHSHPVWGFCFYKAHWSFVRLSKSGLHLLAKETTDQEES